MKRKTVFEGGSKPCMRLIPVRWAYNTCACFLFDVCIPPVLGILCSGWGSYPCAGYIVPVRVFLSNACIPVAWVHTHVRWEPVYYTRAWGSYPCVRMYNTRAWGLYLYVGALILTFRFAVKVSKKTPILYVHAACDLFYLRSTSFDSEYTRESLRNRCWIYIYWFCRAWFLRTCMTPGMPGGGYVRTAVSSY